jgi:hypothetical protein
MIATTIAGISFAIGMKVSQLIRVRLSIVQIGTGNCPNGAECVIRTTADGV